MFIIILQKESELQEKVDIPPAKKPGKKPGNYIIIVQAGLFLIILCDRNNFFQLTQNPLYVNALIANNHIGHMCMVLTVNFMMEEFLHYMNHSCPECDPNYYGLFMIDDLFPHLCVKATIEITEDA